MAQESKTSHNKYYVGEVLQETPQGRMLIEVIAKPDETAMTLNQTLVEILNNQLVIIKTLKDRL